MISKVNYRQTGWRREKKSFGRHKLTWLHIAKPREASFVDVWDGIRKNDWVGCVELNEKLPYFYNSVPIYNFRNSRSNFSKSLIFLIGTKIFFLFCRFKKNIFYWMGKKGKNADFHRWLLTMSLDTNRRAISNAGIFLLLFKSVSPPFLLWNHFYALS